MGLAGNTDRHGGRRRESAGTCVPVWTLVVLAICAGWGRLARSRVPINANGGRPRFALRCDERGVRFRASRGSHGRGGSVIAGPRGGPSDGGPVRGMARRRLLLASARDVAGSLLPARRCSAGLYRGASCSSRRRASAARAGRLPPVPSCNRVRPPDSAARGRRSHTPPRPRPSPRGYWRSA